MKADLEERKKKAYKMYLDGVPTYVIQTEVHIGLKTLYSMITPEERQAHNEKTKNRKPKKSSHIRLPITKEDLFTIRGRFI